SQGETLRKSRTLLLVFPRFEPSPATTAPALTVASRLSTFPSILCHAELITRPLGDPLRNRIDQRRVFQASLRRYHRQVNRHGKGHTGVPYLDLRARMAGRHPVGHGKSAPAASAGWIDYWMDYYNRSRQLKRGQPGKLECYSRGVEEEACPSQESTL